MTHFSAAPCILFSEFISASTCGREYKFHVLGTVYKTGLPVWSTTFHCWFLHVISSVNSV